MSPSESKPQTPVFDTHFHVFLAGQAVPGARYVPAYDAPLAAWQAAARPSGVTHGVLVQTSFMGIDNRLLLAQLAAQPEHLRGVAVVAPTATLANLQPLHGAGVRGIRLNLAGNNQLVHDMAAWAQATALWDALLRLGWHVELHTDGGALPAVLPLLPQALPLVLDHFAKPTQASLHDDTVQAVLRRARSTGARQALPRVHIKLSAAYRLGSVSPHTLAPIWLGELGPQALLWGSDWPCTNHEALADDPALFSALSDWLPRAPEAVEAARSVNPQSLYWGIEGVVS